MTRTSFLARIDRRQLDRVGRRRQDEAKRVDAAVAGDEDVAAESLRAQIVLRGRSRREMHVRHEGDCAAVHFLGVRRVHAISAQARLDVGDRDPAVEGGQGGGEGGRGVALHDHAVGRGFGEDPVDPADGAGEK